MSLIITPYQDNLPSTFPTYREGILDVRNDHAVYDNLVECWLNRRVEEDTFNIAKSRFVSSVGKNSANVHHHAAWEKQISEGIYNEERGTWLLPLIYVPDNVIPAVGDTITGAGYEWTVLIVNRPLHSNCWTLSCNRLFFNLPLTSKIDFWTVSVDVDSYGGRKLIKEKIASDLTCAFQPFAQEEQLKNNRIFFNTQYNVYLKEDLHARIGDLIELKQTQTYESLTWEGFNDLNWASYGEMEFYLPDKLYKIINIENRKRIDEYTKITVRELVNSEEIE